ncbi:hypothetical protein KIN20_028845 [Parelaphostrongylus tenuis]|uniref:Nematode cuticle collagen N-terminal domain-containing protein n=1 Tax=Parelaphostrongylus tenuis TaxID=148309 RepID=A0AAD5R1Q7_PARTN|nr:hypothetical protein KIN20_028845 [Parelaphostrongylus tenuis]
MIDDDVKRLEAEALTLRRVAFVGVAVSTVATLVCVITVPLLYNYMQHMQSLMQSEVDFCKSRSTNIWREVTRTQLDNVGAYNIEVLKDTVRRKMVFGSNSPIEQTKLTSIGARIQWKNLSQQIGTSS